MIKNHINDQDIADLRYIFISWFDIDITEEAARDYGYWLIDIVKLAYFRDILDIDTSFNVEDCISWLSEE